MIRTGIRFKALTTNQLTRCVPLVLVFVSFLVTQNAVADTFCVGTESELEAALTEAESNWNSDYVLIQRGTYTGNFPSNPTNTTRSRSAAATTPTAPPGSTILTTRSSLLQDPGRFSVSTSTPEGA